MDIVILGAGKFGKTICAHLCREGHNITVIDSDAAVVDRIVEDYDVMGICGNGMSIEVLSEAGCARADIFIASSESDEINMVSALFAKKLGARHAVSRVRNPMYSKQTGFMREEMGISMLVNPEFDAAAEISRMLKFPAAAKIEVFGRGRIELCEVRITGESSICNMSLREIGKKMRYSALICAVQRGGEVTIPNGDFILREGDRINLTAAHSELVNFMKETGIIRPKIRSVMIIGGGMIGFYLAKILSDSGFRVKIIDSDRRVCDDISAKLPRCEVILADGTNQEVLIEEGLMQTDAIVTLTGVDEENIIVSLFAAANGVEKVITKVSNDALMPIAESIGLESIITPKEIAANIITTYVRAKQNARSAANEGSIETLYKLAGARLEAIEFKAVSGSYLGVKIKELKIKDNILLAALIKRNKTVIPNGDSIIEAGDRVLVVTTSTNLSDMSQIFR